MESKPDSEPQAGVESYEGAFSELGVMQNGAEMISDSVGIVREMLDEALRMGLPIESLTGLSEALERAKEQLEEALGAVNDIRSNIHNSTVIR